MSDKKFTIEEIRKYIVSQDSLGDVLYNLSEDNITAANGEEPEEDDYGYPIIKS